MEWLLIIFLTVLLLLAYMYLSSYRYRINRISIYFDRLPDGFVGTKFFFISDIHRRKVKEELINEIKKKEQVDLVLIGGDLAEKGVPLSRVKENLRLLRSIAPAYFVWGNHDEEVDTKYLDVIFQQENVKVLNNESVRLESYEGDIMWLLGVEDVCRKKDKLEWAIRDTQDEEGFRILLSHVPTIVRKINPHHKIDLVLSGHTHGGQICLPWIGAITAGVGQYFPKMYSGLYHLGHTKLLISNGYGTSHFPLRFLCPPEVVVIELKKRNHKSDSF